MAQHAAPLQRTARKRNPCLRFGRAENVVKWDAVEIAEAVVQPARFPDKFGVGVRRSARRWGVSALAGVEKPLPVAGDARTVIARGPVDYRAEVFWLRPDTVLVVADVQVERRGSPGARSCR